MRDWREYWRNKAPPLGDSFDDTLREVGKTILGNPVAENQIALITATIRRQLNLRITDYVIDIGCGNGLLTSQLAPYAKEICGFDLSEALIQAARRRYRIHNCHFIVDDFSTFDPLALTVETPDKFVAYEVLQHCSSTETKALLTKLRHAVPEKLRFFIGSIPDFELIRKFYNTKERWRLYKDNVRHNKEQIGHWWRQEEIAHICNDLDLKCEFLEQDSALYTSHYRFDLLVHD